MGLLLIPPYAMLAGSGLAAFGGGGPSDVVAPVLTSPFGLPLGDTSAFQGVTTNEATGTLYFVLTTSATPPSAAQVKAGQDHTGAAAAYAFGQAVSSTGIKSNTATGLTSNTAYYGYLMHEDAAANQSSVAASGILTTLTTGTSDTDFDNLIAAASVAPTNLRKGYVARFIQALYAASVWSKMDVLWVGAAHDEQFGRLNWKDPGNFTLTAINSPTFTTDRGFASDGSTSYLDTGWDPATNGAQITQNNAHIASYSSGFGAGSTVPGFGVQAPGGGNLAVQNRQSASQDYAKVNSSTAVTIAAAGDFVGGTQWVMGRRNDGTNSETWRDGVSRAGPSAATSSALNSTDLAMGRAGTNYTGNRVGIGSVGAYLDDTESAAYYTAAKAYMVALGADT